MKTFILGPISSSIQGNYTLCEHLQQYIRNKPVQKIKRTSVLRET